MKIKDILLILAKSGQDFSDHGMRVDVSGELGPIHGRDCSFCAAWADALYLLTESIALRDTFEPGDEVAIGDVTGLVESVDVVYTVRITDTNGNRRYGRFASEYVSAPRTDDAKFFSDRGGDVWRLIAEKTLALCDTDGKILEGKFECIRAQRIVEEQWGPLVPVKR